ncbi:MAG: RraA family protein [Methanosphaera stadtmanae]|nr:RraA family protein [Methanosphaera stadtmanae]
MSNGKITPQSILHFNKHQKENENATDFEITLDNIVDNVSSDNVSDALKNLYSSYGLLKDVKPLNSKHKIAGFVRTAETGSNDWGTGIKGIYKCKENEILLIKCSDNDYAIWGGIASCAAKEYGLQATVIVGSSRDTEDILELDYPVFSQKIQSRAGLPLNNGTLEGTLLVGDLVIKNGDFIVGDVDGVVVIPQDKLDEVLIELNRLKKFETSVLEKLLDDNQRMDEIIGF